MKKRNLVLVILSIFLIFAMTALISCEDTDVTVTYDASGGVFTNGEDVITIEKQIGTLLPQPVSPSKTGCIFVGWSITQDGSDFWDFNTDALAADTTLYAVWRDAEAELIGVEGGEITGLSVTVAVSGSTASFDFSDVVSVSDCASWILSRDGEGTDVIENKIASGLNFGDNTYYIVVIAKDGVLKTTYTVNVDKDGDVTVMLDANGGELTDTEQIVTYGESYTLPVPDREGYIFLGWQMNGALVTDASGVSFAVSYISEPVTFVSEWEKEKYTVAVSSENTAAGRVSGGGQYEYGSTVTVSATANSGYNFVGWYNEAGELVSSAASYSFTAKPESLVARFEVAPAGGSQNSGPDGQNPGDNTDNNGWTTS